MRSTNQILPLLYKNRLNALSILSFPKSFVVVVVFGDAHLSCAAALLSSRVALRVVRMARKRGRRDDFDDALREVDDRRHVVDFKLESSKM